MYCQCGCGAITPKAPKTRSKDGIKKGEHIRFISGHNSRTVDFIDKQRHRRTIDGHTSFRRMVERVTGIKLPRKADVHHVDGDNKNNANSNLVVCEDRAYHKLLHRRTKALTECGHSNWRWCNVCKKWDDPKNMKLWRGGKQVGHRECLNKLHREYIQNKM